jgi:hypothetical protein
MKRDEEIDDDGINSRVSKFAAPQVTSHIEDLRLPKFSMESEEAVPTGVIDCAGTVQI